MVPQLNSSGMHSVTLPTNTKCTSQYWADVVVCHDYGFIANTTLADGTDLGIPINDTHGSAINKTCFALLGSTAFQGLLNVQDGQASRPDTRTLWCSPNRNSVGPGWLPLTLNTTYTLLGAGADFPGQGYAIMPSNGSGHAEVCPSPDNSTVRFTPNATVLKVGQNVSLEANDLLQSFSSLSHVINGAVLLHDPAFMQYLGTLGGPQALRLFCEGNGQFDRQLCDTGRLSASFSNNQPLRGAVPYEALRYRCSGSRNWTESQAGVFCDHSVSPPLAVDSAGKYLSTSGRLSEDGVIFFGAQALNHSLYLAGLETIVIFLVAAYITVYVLKQSLFSGMKTLVSTLKTSVLTCFGQVRTFVVGGKNQSV